MTTNEKRNDLEYVYVLNAVDHFIFKIYLVDDIFEAYSF